MPNRGKSAEGEANKESQKKRASFQGQSDEMSHWEEYVSSNAKTARVKSNIRQIKMKTKATIRCSRPDIKLMTDLLFFRNEILQQGTKTC